MNILDKRFRYVPAERTNIRLTIARERRRLAEQQKRVVVPITKAKERAK